MGFHREWCIRWPCYASRHFLALPGEDDEQLVGEAAEALQMAKLQAQQTLLLQGVKPSKKDHLVFHQWEIAFEMYACCACLPALRC